MYLQAVRLNERELGVPFAKLRRASSHRLRTRRFG